MNFFPPSYIVCYVFIIIRKVKVALHSFVESEIFSNFRFDEFVSRFHWDFSIDEDANVSMSNKTKENGLASLSK